MYYLQIILGAIILTAIAVPLSNNYKAIKAKNIVAAMGAMVLFAFILLNPYVAGFFEVISAGVAKLSSATAEGTTFVFGSLFDIARGWGRLRVGMRQTYMRQLLQ